MFGRLFKKVSVVVLAGVAGMAMASSSAQAGTVVRQLGAGWVATWDDSQNVDLFVEPAGQTDDALILNKIAFFTTDNVNSLGGLSPIAITFLRQSVNAPQFLVIDSEEVVNQTGLIWNGFTMAIEPSSTKAAFDPAASANFSVSPFTSTVFSDNNRVVTLSGGSISDNISSTNPWYPGTASGELVINTTANSSNRLSDFVLKEQPLTSTPSQAIPLPAAAWSGLSGLAGLVLVRARKNLKAIFA